MANPNKRRGSAWETALASLLNEEEVFATEVLRSPQWGALDRGDLTGTGEFVCEAKNHKSLDLASFVDEAEVERRNAGRRFGVVFVKRRNKGTRDGYAVMRIDQWIELVKEYQQLKEEASASLP